MEPCNTCEECTTLCETVPRMASTFKALGDLTRLQIIYLLSTDTSGTLGVSELATRLKISQPAVSQHLKTLKNEGLVESRREGFYMYYTVNRDRMVEFREHFELMHATIMANCNREMVRRSTRDRNIRACVIFYSFSGITRRVAEGIRNSSGCDFIEVRARTPYTALTAYTKGILHSRKETCDPIEPAEIDVSDYDLLIIGTPVWASKPAPPANTLVRALKGCEGKMAVVFTTYLNQPGEALQILSKTLAGRGVRVMAEISLDAEDTKNPDAGGELLRQIISADPLRDPGEGTPGEEYLNERDVKS